MLPVRRLRTRPAPLQMRPVPLRTLLVPLLMLLVRLQDRLLVLQPQLLRQPRLQLNKPAFPVVNAARAIVERLDQSVPQVSMDATVSMDLQENPENVARQLLVSWKIYLLLNLNANVPVQLEIQALLDPEDPMDLPEKEVPQVPMVNQAARDQPVPQVQPDLQEIMVVQVLLVKLVNSVQLKLVLLDHLVLQANQAHPALQDNPVAQEKMVDPAQLVPPAMLVLQAVPAKLAAPVPLEIPANLALLAVATNAHRLVWLQVSRYFNFSFLVNSPINCI